MSTESDNKEADGGKEAKCLKKEVAELEASLKEKTKLEETYLNQLRYAQADIENLQKHIQKRLDDGVAREKGKLIMQILPLVEELDLVLDNSKKANNSNLLEGMEMVRKKLWKLLNAEGLCPIETIGKPFDPHIHEAVQEVETCECPEGIVTQEVRKGYLLNGRVFRPSLVKVARSPESVKVGK